MPERETASGDGEGAGRAMSGSPFPYCMRQRYPATAPCVSCAPPGACHSTSLAYNSCAIVVSVLVVVKLSHTHSRAAAKSRQPASDV